MPTFSKFLNGFRGCKQLLDSDGYIYSRKKNDDTVLSSAWRCQKNKSLKCPAKCYIALTENTLSLGSKPPSRRLLLNSFFLPAAHLREETNNLSSLMGRLTEM